MTGSNPSESIQLFCATPIPVGDGKRYEEAISVLSTDERERAERFRFDRDRRCFITGRALVRNALSRFASVDPADWRFEANRFDQPRIVGPKDARQLRYSASRTNGLAICAVAKGREIGADVELLRAHPADVVERYFSRYEAGVIRQSPRENQSFLFFANWTFKEAYCKAKGVGLSVPIAKLSFALLNEKPKLTIEPPLTDDSAGWRFCLLRPTPRHVIALCAEVC
ncbi:MAG: 4'-phosphopantetheinyl transferase superfamily protein [Pseudomonadota bacterium]